MGRVNIRYNGKWACFSSIVDLLITPFMDAESYEEWRKKEYGIYCRPILERNVKTIQEAVHSMRMNHEHGEVLKNLIDCGVSEDEAEALIKKDEDEYYRPKLINENYVCPNCEQLVEKNQKRCHNESCEIKFVW